MVHLLVSELRRFQNARCNYKNDKNENPYLMVLSQCERPSFTPK